MPLPVHPSGKKPSPPRGGKGITSVLVLATALSLLTAAVGDSYWAWQPTTLRITVGHPGAAAYIDGNERTFQDKYSDYIWAAIFAAIRARLRLRLAASFFEAE
jgi:hypothetical protein